MTRVSGSDAGERGGGVRGVGRGGGRRSLVRRLESIH